jgi:acyl-CoA reductase-like NAD-dependent aldehyde dehydrogenase
MGVGLDDANLLGPLQNEMQWNVVNRLVDVGLSASVWSADRDRAKAIAARLEAARSGSTGTAASTR